MRALFSVALLMGAIGVTVTTPLGPSALTAMQQASDDLQDFLARSPGERGLIIGSKGKGKGVVFAGDPERAAEDEVLGKVFDLPEPETSDDIAGLVPPAEKADVPLASAPPSVVVPGGFVPGFAAIPPGGFGGTPPGGGGTGGTPPGNQPPGGGNLPVGAVPEPSTWILMIVGFLFAGVGMRRQRRQGQLNAYA